MRRWIFLSVFLIVATPALAQPLEPMTGLALSGTDDLATYKRCLERIETDPPNAFEQAMGWRDQGGGNLARHCVAAALVGLGQPAVAADRLEELALTARTAPVAVRARLLSQSGQAWLAARQNDRAHAALTTALEVAPDLPDLYVDRAVTLAAARNYWEAIDDLNKALDIQPRYGIARALRAAAYRYVDSLDLAMDDAEEAVRQAPGLPEAYLERGILRRLRGNVNGARADWLRVLVLEPDGDAGETARANIERLELRLDEAPAALPPRSRPGWRWNPF
jgi:tetratricopeptide (TPR) repeat protein